MIGFRPDNDVAKLVEWGVEATGYRITDFMQEMVRRCTLSFVEEIAKERQKAANNPPPEAKKRGSDSRKPPQNLME